MRLVRQLYGHPITFFTDNMRSIEWENAFWVVIGWNHSKLKYMTKDLSGTIQ